MMKLVKLVNFESLGDERGELVSLEGNRNIPFEIKRIYYLFKTAKGVSRGGHAHKNLSQVAICLNGSCRFVLDDGNTQEDVVLNNPQQGLLIDSLIWREMHDFSDDCVLAVIANEMYDESDYIRDYGKFKNVSSANDNSPVK